MAKYKTRNKSTTKYNRFNGRKSVRFVRANPWRAVVILAVVVLVGNLGMHLARYSQAENIEQAAYDKCGAYGVKASVYTAQCIAFRVIVPFHGWGPDPGPHWNENPLPYQQGKLKVLWKQESAWYWNATNPNSGAYGIPQSLPADKMNSVYCAHSNWYYNATCQMKWGADYIKNVYGTPSNAEAHEVADGWY